MPHIYTSATFKNGLATITLQQVLGQRSSAVSDFVKREVVPDAKKRLCMVYQYAKLKESTAFQKYFNLQTSSDPFSEEEAASKVRSVLQKMALGLSANHGIKIVDLAEGKYGYVSTYAGGDQGDIHLAKGPILMNNTPIVVMTYIHEASHKFAQTRDHAGKGYLKSSTMEYAEPGLTWREALQNADSYAGLVIRLSNTLLHHAQAAAGAA